MPPREKVRLRFRKGADLRLISHHDLMRCFERMLRRANLPFRTSQGFNPKPRLIFALSLPLGIVGVDEVVELELSEALTPEEVQARLNAQCPKGLEILSARRIPWRDGAQPRRVTYRIALPPERLTGLAERVDSLLAAPQCLVDRVRPHPRKIDLRPFFDQIRIEADALVMDLWVLPAGLARPNEVLDLLGLSDLLDQGVLIERTRLEIHDETLTPGPSLECLTEPGEGRAMNDDRITHEEGNVD